MGEILLLLWHADWVLLAFSVLIFEVPRYSVSLVSLGWLALSRRTGRKATAPTDSISVVLPTFNGGDGLLQSIASLRRQTYPPYEIIVVDDGSTDRTRAIARAARDAGLIDHIIPHRTRCGRSPAVNAAARFARGDLILTVDADTVFEANALAHMAGAFRDGRAAAVSCNLRVKNESASLWTELQGLEYLLSISAGKAFLAHLGAISCCSGACSMYRRTTFLDAGGLDVGPGEDIEFTLRLRRMGHHVGFVPEAWAATMVPESFIALARQRLRWDRDALRVRLIQFREMWPFRSEGLADTLQRLDFIVFDLIPTVTLPFYIAYCVALFGADAPLFLAAVSVLISALGLINLALASVMFSSKPRFFNLLAAPIFPLYNGLLMKTVRLWAFTAELLFATSRHDDYVPPRVRKALSTRLS
ncbi:glycosyltransferase [Bosea sp. BIWAKO-01]|uniref:glycosyltransferase family 2 protein n=1 Tax=Bosea sp. BIWAKO-01 TaxID=506668 RepID=UPI000853D2D3|nr:glycosyltransferase [Bosea sp. BIWAKO-01]GAU86099.1 glycosyl transferase and polysaccharide deacetylase fusion [Bosea sp. BIWAKO-01]